MKQERYRQLKHVAGRIKTKCLYCDKPIDRKKLEAHSRCIGLAFRRSAEIPSEPG